MDISHDIIGRTPVDPRDWKSALNGKLVRVKLMQPQLLFRVKAYDHGCKMLLLSGPVPGHDVCDDGTVGEVDEFWDHRRECTVVQVNDDLR